MPKKPPFGDGEKQSKRDRGSSHKGDSLNLWDHANLLPCLIDYNEKCREVGPEKVVFSTFPKQYGIPVSTLRDHVMKYGHLDDHGSGGKGKPRALTEAEEEELVEVILEFDRLGFPLTRTRIRSLAFQYTVVNDKPNIFSKKEQMAGKRWMNDFLKRHASKLNVKVAEHLSVSRAMGANRVVINKFFDQYEELLRKLNIVSPVQVWNVDETGMKDCPDKKTKVVSQKGKKAKKMRAKEHGELSTAVSFVNAEGKHCPPMVIHKGGKVKDIWRIDCPPSVDLEFSENGYINCSLFLKYGCRWLRYLRTHSLLDRPHILLLDSHGSHVYNIRFMELMRENNIHVLSIPPHTSHLLQPLDDVPFARLEQTWEKGLHDYLFDNTGKFIPKWHFFRIFNVAWKNAMTPKAIMAGFRKTGIYPINRAMIDDSELGPSEVFDNLAHLAEANRDVANRDEANRDEANSDEANSDEANDDSDSDGDDGRSALSCALEEARKNLEKRQRWWALSKGVSGGRGIPINFASIEVPDSSLRTPTHQSSILSFVQKKPKSVSRAARMLSPEALEEVKRLAKETTEKVLAEKPSRPQPPSTKPSRGSGAAAVVEDVIVMLDDDDNVIPYDYQPSSARPTSVGKIEIHAAPKYSPIPDDDPLREFPDDWFDDSANEVVEAGATSDVDSGNSMIVVTSDSESVLPKDTTVTDTKDTSTDLSLDRSVAKKTSSSSSSSVETLHPPTADVSKDTLTSSDSEGVVNPNDSLIIAVPPAPPGKDPFQHLVHVVTTEPESVVRLNTPLKKTPAQSPNVTPAPSPNVRQATKAESTSRPDMTGPAVTSTPGNDFPNVVPGVVPRDVELPPVQPRVTFPIKGSKFFQKTVQKTAGAQLHPVPRPRPSTSRPVPAIASTSTEPEVSSRNKIDPAYSSVHPIQDDTISSTPVKKRKAQAPDPPKPTETAKNPPVSRSFYSEMRGKPSPKVGDELAKRAVEAGGGLALDDRANKYLDDAKKRDTLKKEGKVIQALRQHLRDELNRGTESEDTDTSEPEKGAVKRKIHFEEILPKPKAMRPTGPGGSSTRKRPEKVPNALLTSPESMKFIKAAAERKKEKEKANDEKKDVMKNAWKDHSKEKRASARGGRGGGRGRGRGRGRGSGRGPRKGYKDNPKL